MNQEQIKFLEKIAIGDISGISNTKCGLCYNLNLLDDCRPTGSKFVYGNCSDWKHFSGEKEYPIIGEDSYWGKKLPKWEGEQLELRSSLAKHLLSKLGEK